MQTHIIEASAGENGNYGKFMLGRMTEEWRRISIIDNEYDGSTLALLGRCGWSPDHLWVFDLQTGEGASFKPGGNPIADLQKHNVWVCPLFPLFLAWLYQQDLSDLTQLPEKINIDAPLEFQGKRWGVDRAKPA